ncbi:unnamed protein product [Mytilus coruscus]|uniref:Ig-like domain-containing protein n=1 Tax=Mytilus coruscus TaxID=42192 RepID=A0A6J8DCS9_MYTCO|nr:unnamed protein product [Mytilus coruscus]
MGRIRNCFEENSGKFVKLLTGKLNHIVFMLRKRGAITEDQKQCVNECNESLSLYTRIEALFWYIEINKSTDVFIDVLNITEISEIAMIVRYGICHCGALSYDFSLVAAKYYLKTELRDCVFEIGSKVVLSCEVSCERAVYWFKNGIEISPNTKYELKNKGLVRQLIIRKAQEEDAGDYLCKCCYEKSECTLTVAARFIFTSELIDCVFEIGSDVVLSCKGSDDRDVKWSKSGIEIASNTKYKLKNKGLVHQLIIINAQGEDAGDYLCKCCYETSCCTLKVIKVIEGLKDLEVKNGERLHLTCKLNADVNIKWDRNGQELSGDDQIDFYEAVEENSFKYTLTIKNMKEGNSGVYSCFYQNWRISCDVKVTEKTIEQIINVGPMEIFYEVNDTKRKLEEKQQEIELKQIHFLEMETDMITKEQEMSAKEFVIEKDKLREIEKEKRLLRQKNEELKRELEKSQKNVHMMGTELEILKEEKEKLEDRVAVLEEYIHATNEDHKRTLKEIKQLIQDIKTSGIHALNSFIMGRIQDCFKENSDVIVELLSKNLNQIVFKLHRKNIISDSEKLGVECSLSPYLGIRDLFYYIEVNDKSEEFIEVLNQTENSGIAHLVRLSANYYFTSELKNSEFAIGTDVVLSCEISNDRSVQWFKNGIELSTGSKYTLKNDVLVHQLIIFNAQEEDAGDYLCECCYAKTKCRLKAGLQVIKALRDLELVKGETLHLSCKLNRDLNVKWLKMAKKFYATNKQIARKLLRKICSSTH